MIRQAIICAIVLCLTYTLVSSGSSSKSKSSDASSSKAAKLSKHSLVSSGSSSESKSSKKSKSSDASNEETKCQTCNEQGVCATQFSTKDCGSNIEADILFLVDASGSVKSDNFQKQKDFMAYFAKSFVIGPDNVQIGVATFDHDTYNQFDLSTYLSIDTLVSNIENIPYSGGGTAIYNALAYAKNHGFTNVSGDRPQVANIVIFMTDGYSSWTPTRQKAEELHQMDIEVYSMGIGPNVFMPQMQLIATDAQHVFNLQGFDSLDALPAKLKKSLCSSCTYISDLVSEPIRLADSAITATSYIDEYKPFYGRYDHFSSWRPSNQSSDEYIQFAFASVMNVVGFKFQSNHTTKYNITTSTDCTEFNTTLPEVSTGNEIEVTSMFQEPVLAKCVRFYALEWQGFIQMNIAILGC